MPGLDAFGAPLSFTNADDAAFSSAVMLTPGASAVAPGRSLEVLITTAGNISMVLASGATHVISVPASPYTATYPYSITGINTSGTTAVGTFFNLN